MSAGWNTIESDAGVFTYLVEKLGVKDVQFEELISLEPEMLAQLSPLYGVIFLFKYPTDSTSRSRDTSKPQDGTYAHDSPIFFANQVIHNACGTQALLSVLLNHDSRTSTTPSTKSTAIDIGPHLTDFLDFTGPLPPDIRGEALSNTELIRSTHNSFSRASPFIDETSRQATGDEDVFHFIAYTPIDGVLYELDGLQQAPISHGECTSEEFPVKVVDVLQKRIARYPPGEIRFNLLAMTRDLRIKAKEVGDQDWLRELEEKRKAWVWENALRGWNFVGFAGEVLKAVAQEKIKKGEGEKWVEESMQRTKRRVEERRKKGGGDAEMDID